VPRPVQENGLSASGETLAATRELFPVPGGERGGRRREAVHAAVRVPAPFHPGVRRYVGSRQDLFRRAYELNVAGHDDEALVLYRQILQADAGSRYQSDAHVALAEWHFKRGEFDAALAAAALALFAVARPQTVRAGTHLRTGAGDFQLLPLGERGVAFVSEQTDLDLDLDGTPTLRLHRGSVRLVIRRHQGQPFVVLTSAAEVAVLGTEFDVTVGAPGTEVRVVRGEVEVRNAQGRRRLWAGESARARPGEPPPMVVPTAAVIVDGPAVIERRRRVRAGRSRSLYFGGNVPAVRRSARSAAARS
jgi:hypothetical protein